MKIVIFTDLHVFPHRFGAGIDEDTGRQSRLQDCLDVLDQTANLVSDIEASHRLFLGDMFHVRGRLAPSFLNPVIDHYRTVHHPDWGHKFKDLLIVGNHDMEARVVGENAMRSLRSESVGILEDHGLGVLTDDSGEEVFIGWVSYDPSVKEMKSKISAVAASKRTTLRRSIKKGIFVIHHGIDGSMPNIPDCGLAPNDLPTDDFDWCFCGDYHMHSELVAGKAWMVGAPLHHNFGDAGQKRGWMTLDTITNEVTFVENTKSPQFIALEKGIIPSKSHIKGNFIRLRHDDQKELDDWSEIIESYEPRAIQKELVREWKTIERSEVELSMSTEQMFKAWLDKQETGDLDKSKIEDLNLEILDEAGVV